MLATQPAEGSLPSRAACSNFNQMSKTASASQTITTNSGAKVHLGGYGLGAGGRLEGRCMMERRLLDEAACAHAGAWRLPAAACGTPSTPRWELARPSFCNSPPRPALPTARPCRCPVHMLHLPLAGPAALTLDPAFVANAKPLFDAAMKNDVDQVGQRGLRFSTAFPGSKCRPALTAALDAADSNGSCATRQRGLPAAPLQGAAPPAAPSCLLCLANKSQRTALPLAVPCPTHPVQYALQSFIDNYGTHYVQTVYWGGLGEPLGSLPAMPAGDVTRAALVNFRRRLLLGRLRPLSLDP